MSAYEIKVPATVEGAVKFLEAAEQMAAVAARIADEAREHVETLRRKRRAAFRVVEGGAA